MNKKRPADIVTKGYFGFSQNTPKQTIIKELLSGIPWVLVIVPGVFYLTFSEVGPIGWGLTVFFTCYLILASIAIHYRDQPDKHAKLQTSGSLGDKIGGLWLLACVFGPLIAWIIGQTGLYGVEREGVNLARVFFSAILPILSALPLLRYVHRKNFYITIPILIIITGIAIFSHWELAKLLIS
jgi:hypothetical protein